MRAQSHYAWGAMLFLTAFTACSEDPSGPGGPNDDDPPCDADNGGLTLPANFCAVVVARDLGKARHIAVRDNGDVYVAIDNSTAGATDGGIMALRDTDGDGKADQQQKFGPTGGNGIYLDGTALYFAPNDRVLRYTLSGDALVPSGAPAIVVSGLTVGGDHQRKTVVVEGNDLYVNIGSASNSCQVANREDGSPGVDPCPELDVRSGVWRFDANGTNQDMADGTRFASELRNMNALAIDDDGTLYGAQNGRDQLFDNWGDLFTAQDDALLPAEELFRIESGKQYGWPYCYFDAAQGKKVLAPEYGGDGEAVGRCADREDPIATYPAHWAPLGMVFYDEDMFPANYRGGLFIAWHGSRFDATQQPAGPGFNVTFTRFENDNPVGPYQVFADGFAGGTATPSGAAHRPVAVAVGPDGSLYITDDKAGWVWRVYYKD